MPLSPRSFVVDRGPARRLSRLVLRVDRVWTMRIGRTKLRLVVFIMGAPSLTYLAGALLGSVAQVAVATGVICAGLFIAAGVPLAQLLALKTSLANDRRRRLESDDETRRGQEAVSAAVSSIGEARRADAESLLALIARNDRDMSRLTEHLAELSSATASLREHLRQIVATSTEQSVQMQRVIAVVDSRPRPHQQPSDLVSAAGLEHE